ncbi:MAG: 2-amino-4-hydroxy-6-hydroxymethyldihydropteridine diphosphokinase [Halanaerobium sp. MDAL1]|jgi:2-amino-4-hydroxy-6-hydroxymethyldihydropteridine diphosphokinase|nr:MAG: 2-amino-4-hydroxy-6-hydroxymethyldihydropteridine diphosphokinase [Halanaerobium sp. MDAL1]
MEDVYLGLGSNIEPKVEYLKKAVIKLAEHDKIVVKKTSSLYLTKAYGYQDQADFINAVVHLKTALNPEKMLQTVLQIEKDLGRVRTKKWGPRTIDIDILFFGDLEYQSNDLIIPHPEIKKRAFVLIPLIEAAENELFIENMKIEKWLERLDYDQNEVQYYAEFPKLNLI